MSSANVADIISGKQDLFMMWFLMRNIFQFCPEWVFLEVFGFGG